MILVISLAFLISGCGTGPKIDNSQLGDGWAEAGLSKDTVTVFQEQGQYLYAGTSKGLFKQDLTKSNNDWSNLGLNDQRIVDYVILSSSNILVGVDIRNFASGKTSLYMTTDEGKSWNDYLNGYGGVNRETWIDHLEWDPTNPDIIYAARGSLIAKSTDGGLSWNPVFASWDGWGGFNHVLKADLLNPGVVWVGGVNAFFQPSLFKSTNFGDTWKSLQDSVFADHVETTIFDMLINSEHSDTLLIGEGAPIAMGNGIKRSTNGGKSWTKVYSQTAIYALAEDPVNNKQVYASGVNQDSTLFFASSPDFGETWKIVTSKTGPMGVYIKDLICVTVNGKEVLYFGTNKGVYSYDLSL